MKTKRKTATMTRIMKWTRMVIRTKTRTEERKAKERKESEEKKRKSRKETDDHNEDEDGTRAAPVTPCQTDLRHFCSYF